MELTKQDKTHIKERVNKLQYRVVDEAAEYARLYEKPSMRRYSRCVKNGLRLLTFTTNK